MHMADALISPVVGGTMIALTAGIAKSSVKKIHHQLDDKKIPLMGVMGAFVFASQMINFSIPGTGSSGHIGGGMLLAIILGPYAGFLTMASVLLIQGLFFADGGLLAYVFNLGFYTCFIAYPLIYRKITKGGYSSKRIIFASIISSMIALQLGAFSVVLETLLSGRTELPFTTFFILMQGIHLIIGAIEGVITAAVISFVWKARPEIIEKSNSNIPSRNFSMKKFFIVTIVFTVAIGGLLSSYASSNPDGLEWSINKTAGTEELQSQNNFYRKLSELQNKIAILPDYSFKESKEAGEVNTANDDEVKTSIDAGTSLSGILGGAIIIVFVVLCGFIIIIFKRIKRKYN
ncbi:MAG: energy-coupling factor ABC transporter permease [Clostridiaceae bacterium]